MKTVSVLALLSIISCYSPKSVLPEWTLTQFTDSNYDDNYPLVSAAVCLRPTRAARRGRPRKNRATHEFLEESSKF